MFRVYEVDDVKGEEANQQLFDFLVVPGSGPRRDADEQRTRAGGSSGRPANCSSSSSAIRAAYIFPPGITRSNKETPCAINPGANF